VKKILQPLNTDFKLSKFANTIIEPLNKAVQITAHLLEYTKNIFDVIHKNKIHCHRKINLDNLN